MGLANAWLIRSLLEGIVVIFSQSKLVDNYFLHIYPESEVDSVL